MGDSVTFGRMRPKKAHLLRGAGGLSAEIADVRDDMDLATTYMEDPRHFDAKLPIINGVVIGSTQAGATDGSAPLVPKSDAAFARTDAAGLVQGIANDADAFIRIDGYNLDLGYGRDAVLIKAVNNANSPFTITAHRPGDSKIRVAFFDTGTQCHADGRHITVTRTGTVDPQSNIGTGYDIHIEYDGADTPVNLRTALLASVAKDLINIHFASGNGSQAIGGTSVIDTLGSTTDIGTSAFIPLSDFSAASFKTAPDTVTQVSSGSSGKLCEHPHFWYGGIGGDLDVIGFSGAYDIDEAPTANRLFVKVDFDLDVAAHASNPSAGVSCDTLTPGALYNFEAVIGGYRSSITIPCVDSA